MDFAVNIARIAHEVNRAYCRALGDFSQLRWAEAPQWQRDSAINGVKFILANPAAGPEDSHKSWMKQKAEEGWTYSLVKNPDRKEHPCMVPYDQLPLEQRVKDHLFQAVVKAMADFDA